MLTGSSGSPDREPPQVVLTKTERRRAQDEAEVLRKLAQPGCVFCREEEEAEERFFVWYLAESYHFSETLNRMIRSRGFCRVHAQTFTEDGIPSTIAFVYRFLASSAREAVEGAERLAKRSGKATDIAKLLLPTATCLACARREAHVPYVQQRLARVLADPKSRPSLPSSPAVCLPHLRALAPHLDRNGLHLLAAGLRERLAGEDPRAALTWVWGAPPPPPLSAPEGDEIDAGDPTTRRALRNALAAPGCPVCQAETHAVLQYTPWLAREISVAPIQSWSSALCLCPEHGWRFARSAEDAVEKLAAEIQRSWADRLAELTRSLAAVPAGGPGSRWRFVRLRMGSRTTARGEAFCAALSEALRSGRRTAQIQARRTFRLEPCPLCQAVGTAAERTIALIAASLGDPTIRRAYEIGDGLCLRHLPAAVARARRDELLILIRPARVRLAVLEWKLEEFLRKQSWTVRYEAMGSERGAWQKAAQSLSGIDPAA